MSMCRNTSQQTKTACHFRCSAQYFCGGQPLPSARMENGVPEEASAPPPPPPTRPFTCSAPFAKHRVEANLSRSAELVGPPVTELAEAELDCSQLWCGLQSSVGLPFCCDSLTCATPLLAGGVPGYPDMGA